MDDELRLTPMANVEGVSLHAAGHGEMLSCSAGREDLWVYGKRGHGGQDRLAGKPDAPVKVKRDRGNAMRDDEWVKATIRKWKQTYQAALFLTTKQRLGTARVTSVVDDKGIGLCNDAWKPIRGVSRDTAKAWAVFLNSTLGRVELMRHRGRLLDYPMWRPRGMERIHVPNPEDAGQIEILAACYDATCDTKVDRYDAGQVPVREAWDDAVAKALSMDREKLREFARMLNEEPVVSQERFRARVRRSA